MIILHCLYTPKLVTGIFSKFCLTSRLYLEIHLTSQDMEITCWFPIRESCQYGLPRCRPMNKKEDIKSKRRKTKKRGISAGVYCVKSKKNKKK